MFQVKKDNLWGYMNPDGHWLIPPQYHAVQEFSEGCAAVREEGLYGYINENGLYIIPPSFDYAYPFINGIAKVFVGSKPYYISKENKKVFEHDYQNLIYDATADCFIIQTGSHQFENGGNKFGLVDRQNKMVIASIYESLTKIDDYLYHVYYLPPGEKLDNMQQGVLSYTGDTIIAPGKYSRFQSKGEGWVSAWKPDGSSMGLETLINMNNPYHTIPLNDIAYITEFSEGMSWVSPVKKGNEHGIHLLHESGTTSFIKNAERISSFYQGVAFVRYSDGNTYLINKELEHIAGPFEVVSNYQNDKPFDQGVAMVMENRTWKLIAPNAVTTCPDLPANIKHVSHSNDIISFTSPTNQNRYYHIKTKVLFPEGITLLHPYQYCKQMSEYVNKNTEGEIIEKGILNNKGEIIFKHSEISVTSYNIDFQLANYPSPLIDLGVLDSGNRETGIFLEIGHDETKGKFISIINTSEDTIKGEKGSNSGYFHFQVKNEHGHWTSIHGQAAIMNGIPEYYYDEFHPGHYYRFSLPAFTGSISTFMQVLFQYIDKNGQRQFIYSEATPCSINPGQLWRGDWNYDRLKGSQW